MEKFWTISLEKEGNLDRLWGRQDQYSDAVSCKFPEKNFMCTLTQIFIAW